MKKLLIMLMILSIPAFAETKDETNLKNVGTQSNVNKSGNQTIQYCNMPKEIKITQCNNPKVIYKTKYIKTKAKIVVKEKILTRTVTKEVVKEKRVYKKNRVRFLGGYGPNGVSAEKEGNKAVATEEKGGVFGLGYDRLLTEKISIGAQIQTNETLLLSVGLDF